jgi:Ca2+-binding EF-hand superfamily protein
MKKTGQKDLQAELASKVFAKAEVEVFKRVFDKLAKGGETIRLQTYVKQIKDMTKNKEDNIMKLIISDLENDGDETLTFKQFIALMEEKVGDLESASGIQRIFTFIAKDPAKQRVTLQDLQRIRDELGLSASDKDLQRLVNFVTISFKERVDFTYEEFERFVLKHK